MLWFICQMEDTNISTSSLSESSEFEASSSVAEKSSMMSINQAMATTAIVTEVEQAFCECCGHAEECTPAYITFVRGLHCGHWVCGLCAEAVKEECQKVDMGVEDALKAHMSYCTQFNKPGMEVARSPVTDLVAAVKRMLRRSVDGSPSPHSEPNSPGRRSKVGRSYSYHRAFSGGFESPQ